jgi:hypothetical protein
VDALTAREAVTRVRYYIQDQQGLEWSDDETLSAVDEALESLNTMKSLAGQYHDIDRLTLNSADFTTVQSGWIEYLDLPVTVQRIVSIEGIASGGRIEIIPEGEIDTTRDQISRSTRNRSCIWTFSGPGYPGAISITGFPQKYASFRVNYIRRYPSLAYGTFTGTPTSTSGVLSTATGAGDLSGEDDGYIGLRIALEGTQGLTRRVTDWAGGTSTVTWSPTATAPATGTNWSFCVPLAPEHGQVLVTKTAYLLAVRAGNTQYMAANLDVLKYHEDQFMRSISARSTGTPRRRYSSRG